MRHAHTSGSVGVEASGLELGRVSMNQYERDGTSPSPTQTTFQHGFRRLFALEASGETIRTTAWAHGIGKWRQHRGSRGAGGRWRREATLTRPVKWADLKQFAHDGIATGEALS